MATFSRVAALLIIAVFITYHRESKAYRLSQRVPVTREILRFDSFEARDNWIGLGADNFGKTFDIICWYAQLKAFPSTSRRGYFSDCTINITGKHSIPEYHSKCEDLLYYPNATPNANEGSILDDGDLNYAFKAYFHCLIHQMREMHGDKAIETITQERIAYSKKDWMQTIHDRLNEFRSRHGVEALQLNKTLISDAQRRATSQAESCTVGESTRDDLTAENIYHSDIDFSDGPVFAYECVNHWYKGVLYYPFPQGSQSETFKNFVNVVWKASKTVGYGYAFNPKCGSKGEGYVVARFNPVEKKDGEYKKNVLAPKHPQEKENAPPPAERERQRER